MADIDRLLLAAEEQEAFSTHLEGWEIVESYSHSELYKDDHGPVLIENKTIGSLSEQITIEGESISQYIEFETNRFQDGVDLSNTAIMIHFERGESALDTKPINFYRSEDRIRFGWVVPASVAAETTDIRLCVWSTWEVDEVPYVWKTRPATYSIQDGLMLGANTEEPDEEWYTSFIRVLDEKVTSAANSAVEARTSEENAESSEIEAKKSESNAQDMAASASESAQLASTKASEAAQSAEAASNSANLAEEYKNQAFSTTPEGYEEVVNTVEKNRIKVDTILEKSNLMFDNSASGESIHLIDSTDNKAVEFALIGNATQNGTPTPDAPVDIEVAGASGSVEVKSIGKNFIPYPYYETNHTDNGIVWEDLGDGRLKANGTATGNSDYFMIHFNAMRTFKAGTYIVNGCPSGGGESTHSVIVGKIVNGTFTRIVLANESGATFTLTEDTDIYVACRVSTRQTVSNLIFEPMISFEGGEYESYKESKTTIQTGKIAGIQVESGGNYTDASGQQWVIDEIVKYADGTGKHIQRIGHKTYNGSESIWRRVANESYSTVFYGDNSLLNMIGNRDCLSNRFVDTKLPIGQVTSGYTYYNLNSNMIYFAYGENSEENTLEGWKEFLSNNNLEFYYVLAEPIITDLTAEEVAELEAVRTFYPTTNILNDEGCGMEMTYKADTKNYIDKTIGERITALINNL